MSVFCKLERALLAYLMKFSHSIQLQISVQWQKASFQFLVACYSHEKSPRETFCKFEEIGLCKQERKVGQRESDSLMHFLLSESSVADLVIVAVMDDGSTGASGDDRRISHIARTPHFATILCSRHTDLSNDRRDDV